ncbi:pilus assembly protein PilM [Candidatus Sororendozoicomonas aggregata]|uniref:pilus assembly protein PilM n=1 Tax=Candidatus Sororendozoicomonas aggregata TaxID=3073239 RepID=UPI003083A44F
MFELFTGKNKSMLGIDISSAAVKLLELSETSQGTYCLEAYGFEPLPEGAVVESKVQEPEIVGGAIEKALKRSRSGLKKAAIAVSGAAVITKMIEMNASLSDNEMESQITVEADQYIPYPLDEVAIDFEVQSLNPKNPELADVLLAACRRENIEACEEALAIAGLEAQVVDVESFVMERAYGLIEEPLQSDGKEPVVAIIDMGALTTSFYVIDKGHIIYSREQPFGGQQLTDEIQHHYDMEMQEAESAKKSGQLPEDYESQVLVPFVESAVQQISRSLQFFYSSSQYSDIGALLLAGGGSSIKGLAETLEEQLQIKTTVVNPLSTMKIARKVNKKQLDQDAPALMIACGLAMRSFD